MHGSPDRAASAARTKGVRMNEDPVEPLRRPLPRRRRITETNTSASPPRPVSGLATSPPRLPAREAQWHRAGGRPSRPCRRIESAAGIGSAPTRSLTVAGAAQVGSALADVAPCFPFNRARSARAPFNRARSARAPRRRQFRSARAAASRRRAAAAHETSRRFSATRSTSTNDEDISRREAGVLRLETLQISETRLFRAKMLGL